ncbi:MAG: hypothetical protein NTY14_08820 [Candidatus Omnitrophica bacterium]|nr:hypothetical protein [Candidatus Omnitrophota bacterium]
MKKKISQDQKTRRKTKRNMCGAAKQLSNPASTGGLGTHFENRVQASFVVSMLVGGFSPCLPSWPISKIKLQGKHQGFNIDDLIVYATKCK